MKKLLILLALSLQTNVSCSDPQVKVQGEEIETIIDTTYKHPEAKKVGDLMPIPLGEKVSYTITYGLNRTTREIGNVGLIIGYDRNGDKIPEYEFVGRSCDFYRDVKTYAVFDAPHKKLYIDSSRNRHINSIEDIDSLEDVWSMILTCEQEKLSI